MKISAYKPDKVHRYLSAQSARTETYERFCKENEEYQRLVEELIPEYHEFKHALYSSLNPEEALGTSALPKMIVEGLAAIDAAHLSLSALQHRTGCLVFSISLPAPNLQDVDMDSQTPRLADSQVKVEMRARLDREKRELDVEFFSLNRNIDGAANVFDDREKLHLLWRFPLNQSDPALVYIGAGSNQPYRLEHPERAGFEGRPRFYIYDAFDRLREVSHSFRWFNEGRFDWQWANYAPRSDAGGFTSVWMVRFPDNSLHCVSDPEVALAATDLTPDLLAVKAHFAFCMPGPPPNSIDELGDEAASLLLDQFVLLRVDVGELAEVPLSGPAPTVQAVYENLRMNYVPYFVAKCFCAVESKDWQEILPALRTIHPLRWTQYHAIVDERCVDVFVEEFSRGLPERMEDLLYMREMELPENSRGVVAEWKANLLHEASRDLYFYGQWAADRVAPLLLGVHLALRDGEDSVLIRLLNSARAALQGERIFGQLLPRVEP